LHRSPYYKRSPRPIESCVYPFPLSSLPIASLSPLPIASLSPLPCPSRALPSPCPLLYVGIRHPTRGCLPCRGVDTYHGSILSGTPPAFSCQPRCDIRKRSFQFELKDIDPGQHNLISFFPYFHIFPRSVPLISLQQCQ